jgi:hypothetical protein
MAAMATLNARLSATLHKELRRCRPVVRTSRSLVHLTDSPRGRIRLPIWPGSCSGAAESPTT